MECKVCPLGRPDMDCTDCHDSDYRYTVAGTEWFCTLSGEVFEPRYREKTKKSQLPPGLNRGSPACFV